MMKTSAMPAAANATTRESLLFVQPGRHLLLPSASEWFALHPPQRIPARLSLHWTSWIVIRRVRYSRGCNTVTFKACAIYGITSFTCNIVSEVEHRINR